MYKVYNKFEKTCILLIGSALQIISTLIPSASETVSPALCDRKTGLHVTVLRVCQASANLCLDCLAQGNGDLGLVYGVHVVMGEQSSKRAKRLSRGQVVCPCLVVDPHVVDARLVTA